MLETNRFDVSKSFVAKFILEMFERNESSIFFYGEYKSLICHNSTGISSLTSCGTPEELPELPPHDEQRLRRAARLLQQRLVLREWLVSHRLHHAYTR